MLEDITLSEAVMKIDIPYTKLKGIKELHISALIKFSDTTVTNQEVSFGSSGRAYWTGKCNATIFGNANAVMDISVSPRKTLIFDGTISAYQYTLSGTSYKGLGHFGDEMDDQEFHDLCGPNTNTWIRTTAANPMAAGTRFKVWGR